MANSLTSTGLTLGSPQYSGSTTISGIEVMGVQSEVIFR